MTHMPVHIQSPLPCLSNPASYKPSSPPPPLNSQSRVLSLTVLRSGLALPCPALPYHYYPCLAHPCPALPCPDIVTHAWLSPAMAMTRPQVEKRARHNGAGTTTHKEAWEDQESATDTARATTNGRVGEYERANSVAPHPSNRDVGGAETRRFTRPLTTEGGEENQHHVQDAVNGTARVEEKPMVEEEPVVGVPAADRDEVGGRRTTPADPGAGIEPGSEPTPGPTRQSAPQSASPHATSPAAEPVFESRTTVTNAAATTAAAVGASDHGDAAGADATPGNAGTGTATTVLSRAHHDATRYKNPPLLVPAWMPVGRRASATAADADVPTGGLTTPSRSRRVLATRAHPQS